MYSFSSLLIPTILPALPDFLVAACLVGTRPFAFALAFGFGARVLGNRSKIAKYLNSPESLIYNKSKVLYGIFYAKQEIAKLDKCFIVEGYTDVIQLYQKGIKNVVSSSGTSLTSDQITMIRRLTQNITMLYGMFLFFLVHYPILL